MRRVYSPANSAEAHMLAHQLELAGIKTHIHGEALQGGVGELPAAGLLQLMVAEEDYDEARRLLKSWEATQASETAATETKKFPTFLMLTFLAAGLIAGWVGKAMYDNNRVSVYGAQVGYDLNEDDRDDVVYFYAADSATVRKVELDNNFDGRMDVITHYDGMGTPTEEEWDTDFDGFFETKSTFRRGVIERSAIDTNRNEIADVTQTYRHGVLVREELFDEREGKMARVDHYEAGRLTRSESDLDRDGFMETVRMYDRYGEIVNTETRTR